MAKKLTDEEIKSWLPQRLDATQLVIVFMLKLLTLGIAFALLLLVGVALKYLWGILF